MLQTYFQLNKDLMFPRGSWGRGFTVRSHCEEAGGQVSAAGPALTAPPGGHCPLAAGPRSPGREEVYGRVERAQHLPLTEPLRSEHFFWPLVWGVDGGSGHTTPKYDTLVYYISEAEGIKKIPQKTQKTQQKQEGHSALLSFPISPETGHNTPR